MSRTALAESLRALLTAVHDDAEMTASASTRARIEGALVALDVVLGADSTTALARLTDPSPDTT